jgi:hypothetical protein
VFGKSKYQRLSGFISILITSLMILPQNSAVAVDYANTDLLRLIDIKLTGNLISSQKLKHTLEITIQTKVNTLKHVFTYLRGPKRDPLNQQCGTGESFWL